MQLTSDYQDITSCRKTGGDQILSYPLRPGWPLLGIIFVMFFECRSYSSKPGRFSEILLQFNSPRKIRITENPRELSLTLEFQDTSPRELSALYHYDEAVIRRVLIRDLGTGGTNVTIHLKDKSLKAITEILNEPFRLSLSIFDQHYRQVPDPLTGLPEIISPARAGRERQALHGDNHENEVSGTTEGHKRGQEGPLPISSTSGRKRPLKLLQPIPEQLSDSQNLTKVLRMIPDGRGPYWSRYPFYIYPTLTAPYEGRKSPEKGRKKSHNLAEYAYKMYSFGNETKALSVYQQVLRQDPAVFERDVLHLWAFAESHLGQGNLSLADGYFEAIVRKYPASPLSKMAYIRRLDIQSITLLKKQKPEGLSELLLPLQQLDSINSGEILAQKAIRIAYWLPPIPEDYKSELPLTSKENLEQLRKTVGRTESRKTRFLVTSIILRNILHPDMPWTESGAQLATDWLTRYTSGRENPFYKPLESALYSKLSSLLTGHAKKGEYADILRIWNDLPGKIKGIRKNARVSWAVGEALRNMSLTERALPFYKRASTDLKPGPGQFQSTFWLSVLSARTIILKKGELKQASKRALQGQAEQSDKRAYQIWKTLTNDQKNHLRTTYKDYFESTLDDDFHLKTPAIILLETWETALGGAQNGEAGNGYPGDLTASYLPATKLVHLLHKLIERFRKGSMSEERRRATTLLKKLRPEKFKDDSEALAVWTRELSALANEYRTAGEYLKAGRLFTFTAEQSYEWNKRAESLYKGGLLLYRAGKREEAITALTKASQDGNNLFYANLAKERLTKLLP